MSPFWGWVHRRSSGSAAGQKDTRRSIVRMNGDFDALNGWLYPENVEIVYQ
jgi:hypothetical protein